MDKQYAIKMHRELWTWLSKNPEKDKWNWLRWKSHGGTIDSVNANCFCCQYASDINSGCSACPLIWPGGRCDHDDDTGLYNLYMIAGADGDMKLRSKLAYEIANLPENKDA